MCGIAGIFAPGTALADERIVEHMIRVQRHRGPDDAGSYVDRQGGVALGHCRLSIIDLSSGHQPMSNEDGSVWAVFNGEIYNFKELRRELESRGHRFTTQSDTEVVVHAYEAYGAQCVERFRGMFAIAVWDRRDHTLFLARDRAGEKPLYYCERNGALFFASEPKAILACPGVRAEVDPVAIHHYLTWGYVPAPHSAFKGFRVLPPAHWLRLRNGRTELTRYWKLSYQPKITLGEAELCEALMAHLKDAVQSRLMSDVPLGAFLSGGIDSSTVVALMSQCMTTPVKTFSIGFKEAAYNELPYARLVAQRYQTEHREFIVKPDALAILPSLVWHYNEPFADSSAIPTYYLSQLTRQHVTVALDGDAGDENFAGYDRYLANRMAASYDRLPRLARKALEEIANRLPNFGSFKGPYARGKRFFAALSDGPWRRYARWVGFFPNELKAQCYTPSFAQSMAGIDATALVPDAAQAAGTQDIVDATLSVDVATYLPNDLLVKVDIASMSHSLEVRAPLVDHQLMEFAASIPSRWKLRGTTTKYILKRAVKPLLPEPILRRKKMGFGVPIDRWFRAELRDMAYDVLLSRQALGRGLFQEGAIRRLLEEHVSGRADWQFHLWALLMLELWFRQFIDGNPSAIMPSRSDTTCQPRHASSASSRA